jgi:hypothetical protein
MRGFAQPSTTGTYRAADLVRIPECLCGCQPTVSALQDKGARSAARAPSISRSSRLLTRCARSGSHDHSDNRHAAAMYAGSADLASEPLSAIKHDRCVSALGPTVLWVVFRTASDKALRWPDMSLPLGMMPLRRSCCKNVASAGEARRTVANHRRVHGDGEPPRKAVMASAAIPKTASKALRTPRDNGANRRRAIASLQNLHRKKVRWIDRCP